jgi:5-methylcytosine-specific restriction endonuclease McrA
MAMTKEEKAAYDKIWYLKNKTKKNSQAKLWRFANSEKRILKDKEWTKANPEKIAARNKRYHLKLALKNKKISQRTLKAWAAKVKRSQPVCMTCGSTSELHAHHILSKHLYPEFALSLLNGITLCKICHISVHNNEKGGVL